MKEEEFRFCECDHPEDLHMEEPEGERKCEAADGCDCQNFTPESEGGLPVL